MKKTVIYTMLCSTVLFSGALLAVDGKDPIGEEAEKRRQKVKQALPRTPDIQSQISQKYPSSQYTPSTQKILVDMEVKKARRKRDKTLAEQFDEIYAEEVAQRLELAKKQEEQTREEERRKQLTLLEQYVEVIEQEKAKSSKKQEENDALGKQVEALSSEVKELGEKHKRAQMVKEVTVQELEEISQELEEKTKELTATKQKLRSAETQAALAQLQITTAQQAKEDLEKGIRRIVGGSKGASTSVGSSLTASVSDPKKKALPKANLGE